MSSSSLNRPLKLSQYPFCLNLIDQLRDEYGAPESEPRLPDLASGRRWPILKPNPDAGDGN
ncbi:hypothetical protein [Ruegeria atlantica]|uniref:hypothetical protein n=1 Tax=Ruegeria atlantica TaxID=81569 RepID=UPI003F68B61C